MKNFKEIAEKCLAGELSGRFVCRDGLHISSFTLSRTDNPSYPYKLYRVGKLTIDGHTPNKYSHNDIIQFIPYEEMKKEQITIDIPEGMTVIREETPNEIKIKFVKKQLTYDDIWDSLGPKLRIFPFTTTDSNKVNDAFFDKVNVLRKLTNIRNYFGKPDSYNKGYLVEYSRHDDILKVMPIHTVGDWVYEVIFKEKEHAEQAIKMLGDELKYLFEPW